MVKKTKEKKEWVVYPKVELTIDDIIEHLKMSEEKPNEVVDEITAEINAEVQAEELNEEVSDVDENTDDVEMTDEEKREIFIAQLKESKVNFRNVVHSGKVTTSKFGAAYRKKRQNKNKAQRKSRKVTH